MFKPMIVNPIITSDVPSEWKTLTDVASVMRLVHSEAFQDNNGENSDSLNFIHAIFEATSDSRNWKNPVVIQKHHLSKWQIAWVKAAIMWFQGAGLDEIQTSTFVIRSPGYMAW